MDNATMDGLDSKLFPKGFFNVGGKRFDWVFKHKPIFVKFTRDEMKKCTGIFDIWKRYCENKKEDK